MRVLPKLLLLCTWLALGCEAREASFDPDEFEGMGNGVIGAAAGGRAAASDAASADGASAAAARAAAAGGGDAGGTGTGGSGAGGGRSGGGGGGGGAEPAPADSFAAEYLGALFIVLYLWCYSRGRAVNQALADAWLAEFAPLFEQQFEEVGCRAAGADADAPLQPLMKESANSFRFYASGRRYCQFLVADLQLRARQDLLALLWEHARPLLCRALGMSSGGVGIGGSDGSAGEDVCAIEIAMNDEDMEPFVFAVARARLAKTMAASRPDLAALASNVRDEQLLGLLPPGFALLTDCRELVPQLISRKIEKVLKAQPGLVLALHFTDRHEHSPLGLKVRACPHTLRFTFRLPPAERMGELRQLTEMALFFVDLIGRDVRLSAGARKKSEGKRQPLLKRELRESHETRQENVQKRKLAKEQREKEEFETLTPEQKYRRKLLNEKKAEKLQKKKQFRKKTMRA